MNVGRKDTASLDEVRIVCLHVTSSNRKSAILEISILESFVFTFVPEVFCNLQLNNNG